ncbi:hypothetical protein PHYBOEH_008070 [Phytophthora boehmeriae]|uniref:Glutathione transferase n=1 Tax=Phytophthora boehmeriae TaxID=109152 RepID=A0A8T1X1Z2_9STRA|nr:hypothetical protein PHYBOEH_008070 [Phytophthora boehmeriae]
MASQSVKVYVACTSVLYVKFLAATVIQGSKKFISGGRPPEDSKYPQAKRKQTFGMDKPDDEKTIKAREVTQRWGSIVSNDLESIPFALLIFGAGIMAGSDPTVHMRAMIVYTTSRCLHTYAFAKAMQPQRSLCYAAGIGATLVGLGNAILACF